MSSDRAASPAAFAGRRATVMGLGLFGGGAATARWLVGQGAHVTVTDLRDASALAPALAELEGWPVHWALGGHPASAFEGADVVVANPAVPPASAWLERARLSGARVTSEAELFLERCPARVAVVTGTQGKSSTAHLTAQLLEGSAPRVHLGGNIGRSLLEELEGMTAEDVVVLELSSYQLEALTPRPVASVALSVITNVLADHLERHGTAEAYAAAKARSLALVAPGGAVLLPHALAGRPPFDVDDERQVSVLSHDSAGGAESPLRIERGRFLVAGDVLGTRDDLQLRGDWQAANVLVAAGAARLLGARSDRIRRGMRGLVGLPHRSRELGACRGVRIIDNGVSTTPDSTLAALSGLVGPVVLLVGGERKRGLPFDELAARAAASEVRVVAFGAAGATLGAEFRAAGCSAESARDLPGALDVALEMARSAALERPAEAPVLLFSPACASFDAYPNFRARAEHFRTLLDLHGGLDPHPHRSAH